MRLSSSLIALVALAGQALALPFNELAERDTGLDVKLIPIGNTRVKAIITNNADHEMSFVKYNTLFDSSPVRKVQISKDGSIIPFSGIHLYYDIDNLPKEAYKTLAPGASAEAEFDIAETSDLSAGGSFKISAEGSIPVIDGQGTKPTSSIRFKANTLTMDIDGEMASKVASAIPELNKRTRVDNQSCTGQYAQLLQGGLRTCVTYAQRAAQAASGGNAQKFQEYFKTTDQQTRRCAAASGHCQNVALPTRAARSTSAGMSTATARVPLLTPSQTAAMLSTAQPTGVSLLFSTAVLALTMAMLLFTSSLMLLVFSALALLTMLTDMSNAGDLMPSSLLTMLTATLSLLLMSPATKAYLLPAGQ
ncbi:neutral protease 2 [Coccidioides immitis H538.4]|uniref:deuterolysin n=1 Tax=Coccidioides immitis H538.4 TaxID=396776 RepID=A0A0J8S6L4_COCIT|nr:neutral protease 2 [Coccidioides immitis H538.4]